MVLYKPKGQNNMDMINIFALSIAANLILFTLFLAQKVKIKHFREILILQDKLIKQMQADKLTNDETTYEILFRSILLATKCERIEELMTIFKNKNFEYKKEIVNKITNATGVDDRDRIMKVIKIINSVC